MSNPAHVQPKLMDYYLQNPEEFKEKYKIDDNSLHKTDWPTCGIIGIDDSSQYFKFTTIFRPARLTPENPDEYAYYLEFTKEFELSPCPWQQEMKIMLKISQCLNDDAKLKLHSRITSYSEQDPIKEVRVKFNFSIDYEIADEDDIPEETKWNDFNFKFKHECGENDKTILIDTGRATDVKKLWTSDLKMIMGKFSIYIKLSNEFLFKKKLLEEIDWIPDVKNPIKGNTRLSVSFKSKVLHGFDKNILMKISPVFKAMLENPENKEAQESNLVFEEKDVNSVTNFHELLRYGDYFPDFNPSPTNPHPILNLLMLADKYDIKSLYKICTQHISNNLYAENILMVLKVSDMINNERLFEKAMKQYLAPQDKEVQECFLRHPEMIAEMIDLAYVPIIPDN